MPYSKQLTTLACAVALALGASASAQAANVLEVTDSFVGAAGTFQTTDYDFSITAPGTYVATLIDTGIFAPFDSIGLGIAKTGGAAMGVRTSPGSFSFDATETGSYTAIVSAFMGSGAFPQGTYSVSVALVPEAETWAMMLVGMGLVGWQLRRKVKSSAASRFV
jgi:hypothetical protein